MTQYFLFVLVVAKILETYSQFISNSRLESVYNNINALVAGLSPAFDI